MIELTKLRSILLESLETRQYNSLIPVSQASGSVDNPEFWRFFDVLIILVVSD